MRCGPIDLTNGQFSLLMSLNRPKPPNLSSVAHLLAMDRTTLTAALKPLERRGLVMVMPDPADKRSRLLALTPEGMRLLSEVTPIWRSTHGELEALLDRRRARPTFEWPEEGFVIIDCMRQDVDQSPGWVADVETPDAPGLICDIICDLIAGCSRPLIDHIDIVHFDRNVGHRCA